jgi:glycosyltransferase involved in cell wall biosynthesis
MMQGQKRPAVSVLVTVFNREAFLEECLRSILASTFSDLEVVVVDDASTDGSVSVANRIAATDSRVRLSLNEKNLGDYPNRNRAAALASGEYLKFVDADDVLYPHSLAVMIDAMRANPEAALGLSWNVIDPDRPYPFASTPRETFAAHFLGTSLFGVGPSASIIRRDKFAEAGGFRQVQFVGDTDLWFRLASKWPLVSLPPALVWWRRHEGQQMSAEHANRGVLETRFNVEKEALEQSSFLTDDEKRVALKRIERRYSRRLASLALREGEPGKAAALWKQSGLSMAQGISALLPTQDE